MAILLGLETDQSRKHHYLTALDAARIAAVAHDVRHLVVRDRVVPRVAELELRLERQRVFAFELVHAARILQHERVKVHACPHDYRWHSGKNAAQMPER